MNCACGGSLAFVRGDLVCESCGRPGAGPGALCRACQQEVWFGHCGCGDAAERVCNVVGALLEQLAKRDALLAAAMRDLAASGHPAKAVAHEVMKWAGRSEQ